MGNSRTILLLLVVVVIIALAVLLVSKYCRNKNKKKCGGSSGGKSGGDTPPGPGEPTEDEVFFIRLTKADPGILRILLGQKTDADAKNVYLTLVKQLGYSPVTLKDLAKASIDGALWCLGGIALDNTGNKVVAAWPVSKAAVGTNCQGNVPADKLPSVAVTDLSAAKGVLVMGKKPQPAFRPGGVEILPWILPRFTADLDNADYSSLINGTGSVWSKYA